MTIDKAGSPSSSLRWALPESLKIPPDELQVRLDFYSSAVMLYSVEKGVITTKMVSARDVAMAMLRNVNLKSGLLPEGTLWWAQGRNGVEVALWRKPQVWKVALQMKALAPPRRFSLPMPGLLFVCSAGRPPAVYATKRRPSGPGAAIYHAPLFNIYQDGRSCPGTHKYPDTVDEIPESFFMAFFTMEAENRNRSVSHPDSLFALWEKLDGKKKYPMDDLVPMGKLEDVMK